MDELIANFKRIGLAEDKAKETAGNKKLSQALAQLIELLGGASLEWSAGCLLYDLAALHLKSPDVLTPHLPLLIDHIKSGKWRSKDQVSAGVNYIKATKAFSVIDLDKESGVGVEVSEADVTQLVGEMVTSNKARLVSDRYRAVPTLYKAVRDHPLLKWADGKAVKDEIDKQCLALLGPKDERDTAPKKAKKEKSETPRAEVAKQSSVSEMFTNMDPKRDPFYHQGELSRLHKPGGNPQIAQHLMDAHLKATGGKLMTRFPPEPNGHLHIGHAKAINVNFGYAVANDGLCYLRYDDTNPEAEEEQFFLSIKDSVEWLGFKPWKITYSSDHFQKLFDLAVDLIRRGKAYVCHCTGEEIHDARGGDERGPRYDCKHRDRPIEESLKEFQRMKEGCYKEGEAILRMKMDMQNPNPQFWDLVAYRVLYTPHYRTGKDWCIYPTYDYTHCLCDSFENITHSLCTTEFRASRESYYWLCDALEVYKPVQWEYGRLNLTGTVLSKRKLTKLVEGKYVDGWDDPRLYTLIALKRRGFTPEAINRFVRDGGLTTANTSVDMRNLEFYVRQHLDENCIRTLGILNPIMIYLTNVDEKHYQELDVALMPKSKAASTGETRKVPFTNKLFIDASDFKADDPNFFRLAVHGTVGLLNVPHPILCVASHDIEGQKVLECLYLDEKTLAALTENPSKVHKSLPAGFKVPKQKAFIQWLALSYPTADSPNRRVSPQKATFRIYSRLFLHDNPMDKVGVPGGWLSDINPDSLAIAEGYIESGIRFGKDAPTFGKLDLKPSCIEFNTESKVQMTRIGYYCVDRDTKVKKEKMKFKVPKLDSGKIVLKDTDIELPSGWVWNQTVTLREDNKKDS